MITSTFTHSAREWIPTKQETLEAMLATKEPNEKYSALIHPSTQEFIDFDVMGHSVESANLGAKKAQEKVTALERQEEEENAEQTRNDASAATANFKEYKEAQEQKMFEMYGRQFSAEAMQEVAKEDLSNFEKLARERGWTQEQQETISEALLVLQDPKSTDAQREQALKDIDGADSEYAKDRVKKFVDYDESKLENKNDSPKNEEMTDQENNIAETKLDDLDAMLAGMEDAPLAQQSYADAMDVIKNSNIGQSSQEAQQVAEINEVTPNTPKGMTLS